MNKTYKTWLKIAGIVSFVFAGLILFVCMGILIGFLGIKQMYEEMLAELIKEASRPRDIDYMRWVTSIEFVLACGINVYSGYIQLSLSKREYIVVGSSRVLTNIALFQMLFTANIFSAIISLVVAVKLNKSVWENKGSNSMDAIAHEVEKIRILKEKGVITEEEWQKRLDALLEQYSVSQQNLKWK